MNSITLFQGLIKAVTPRPDQSWTLRLCARDMKRQLQNAFSKKDVSNYCITYTSRWFLRPAFTYSAQTSGSDLSGGTY